MKLLGLALFIALGSALQVHAQTAAVNTCMDHGQVLNVDNNQVLQWKHTSANEFHARGHVLGKITNMFPDQTGHNHFEITLDATTPDTIEIVYDFKFGALPTLHMGDKIEACGDYITSNAPFQHYPASPDGAMLHWVHRTDTPRHDGGFVIVNDTLFGQN